MHQSNKRKHYCYGTNRRRNQRQQPAVSSQQPATRPAGSSQQRRPWRLDLAGEGGSSAWGVLENCLLQVAASRSNLQKPQDCIRKLCSWYLLEWSRTFHVRGFVDKWVCDCAVFGSLWIWSSNIHRETFLDFVLSCNLSFGLAGASLINVLVIVQYFARSSSSNVHRESVLEFFLRNNSSFASASRCYLYLIKNYPSKAP